MSFRYYIFMVLLPPLFVVLVSTVCLIFSVGFVSKGPLQILFFSFTTLVALLDSVLIIIGKASKKTGGLGVEKGSLSGILICDFVGLAISSFVGFLVTHFLLEALPAFGGDLHSRPILCGLIFGIIIDGPISWIVQRIAGHKITRDPLHETSFYIHNYVKLLCCTIFLCICTAYLPSLIFDSLTKGRGTEGTMSALAFQQFLISLFGPIGFASYFISKTLTLSPEDPGSMPN